MRIALAALIAALVSTVVVSAPARAETLTPIVFVHGQQGSAQQWQSNAKRFSGNGYPDALLHAYEYDTSVLTNDHAIAGLEAFIADVKARTGSSKVDVVAHSRGTIVLHTYLSSPARAASVRRYVNVDGRSSATPPGGVPTLALWGSLQPTGFIGGAVNVHLTTLGHTETTTSADGFAHMYRFLRGRSALTTRVLPELPTAVRIAGRATYYPENEGVDGVVQVWQLDGSTGARVGTPRHTVRTGSDGSFGPLPVDGREHYELVVLREGQSPHHFYFEPFERSDRFLRLQLSRPGGVTDNIDRCSTHTALTIIRNREWWSDQLDSDRLELNGVNVLAPAVSPRLRQVLAAFAFDDGCDLASTPGVVLPPFATLPFLTGVDAYLPARADGGGTIRVTEAARGDAGRTRTIAVPNWPSDAHSVTVQFNDYLD
ncbi:hypothetical protein ACIGNX_09830 [Actinosynnema sp. NPDC053489]|uniref:hypothetical protein n=1 Tax=Actinosynnema sp. NPDC053489 TaxID=3363916 RepID=UPI0037C6DD9C